MEKRLQPFEEKTIVERIHRDFMKEIRSVSKERFKKDLDDDLIPVHEVTRMMLNADHWNGLRDELTSKQRKKQ